METDEARQFIQDLYTHLIGRHPGQRELDQWTMLAVKSLSPAQVLRAFIDSKEYKARNMVYTLFAAGHYHSPVVDPATVRVYFDKARNKTINDLAGINIDLEEMMAFWDTNLAFIQATPFTEAKDPARRFYYTGSPYPWGDAIMLRAMINHYRPQRVIEIGSGFSTACMLDSADECGHLGMQVTCIEPYPNRLHSLLRPADYERVELVQALVQDVELDLFDALRPGDMLFIDSTHVLKTGSDVHYELFSILPRLRTGVLVHVHDCPFPFEYPEKWVFELNYSWNEAYALRAILMYSNRFKIRFWNSALAKTCRGKIQADYPSFLRNAGTSIWLTVC